MPDSKQEVDVSDLPALTVQPDKAVDYPAEYKAKAFHMYLNSGMSLDEIAIAMTVPRGVVAYWSAHGNWSKARDKVELELYKSAEQEYRRVITQNRIPTLIRHLEVSKKLETIVSNMLDSIHENIESGEYVNTTELKRLAEILAAASAVSARAVGLRDMPSFESPSGFGMGPDGNGKQPLVVINTGSLSPRVSNNQGDREEKTIDAEVRET